MLEYKTALELILKAAIKQPTEKVKLKYVLKRVLGADIFHDMNMPPFNKSAVDGFACRKEDSANKLEVIETVYAGKLPEKRISTNQCYKIMTGAVVPDGADYVFKKEDTQVINENEIICTNPSLSNNICYRGEDVQKGDKVLDKSTLVLPKHLPIIAGAGITDPVVYKQPGIKVFATGTELVEPDKKPLSFQIRNSNSSQLLAQINDMNINPVYGGILQDDELLLTDTINKSFDTNQVVILTGGVSVGDYDFIPDILTKLGFTILVSSTAIKPGKPMVFAQKGEQYCFGLSGNPVSSFIQFELYVKPFLYALMGHSYQQKILSLPLENEYKRRNAERINFVPANVNSKMNVTPVDFHGSAHINALSNASFIFEVPIGIKTLKKGELVNVRSI